MELLVGLFQVVRVVVVHQPIPLLIVLLSPHQSSIHLIILLLYLADQLLLHLPKYPLIYSNLWAYSEICSKDILSDL